MLESNSPDQFDQNGDSPTECINETGNFSFPSQTYLPLCHQDMIRAQQYNEVSSENPEHIYPKVIIKGEAKTYVSIAFES